MTDPAALSAAYLDQIADLAAYIDQIAEETASRILAPSDDFSKETVKAKVAGAMIKAVDWQRRNGESNDAAPSPSYLP
jgi:hypothetical protein